MGGKKKRDRESQLKKEKKRQKKRNRERRWGLLELNDPTLGAVYTPGINLQTGLPLFLPTYTHSPLPPLHRALHPSVRPPLKIFLHV